MNLYKIKCWLCFAVSLLAMCACKEDLSYRKPSGGSTKAPGLIEEIRVINMPGKAVIKYQLPADQNLLYVKAVYTLTSGKEYQVKSSYFSDSLVVEGFADTLEHVVKLYSVSRREVASAPISVSVTPLKAPIWFVYKSLAISNAFGGYKLTARNKTKAAVGILVMQKNALGEWEVDNDKSVYTSVDSIKAKVSGLDTLVHNFAFAIRDRWGNLTDTLFKSVTPFYEVQLSTTKFSKFPLPGDNNQPGADIPQMWDNHRGWACCFTTLDNATLYTPHQITFDMGVMANVSKVWIAPFKELSNLYYSFTTLKRFEIWGSVNPNPSGALDNTWVLLGSYVLNKPSGPGPTETADDQAQALAGFFWEADINAPKVKYMRIRCLENFAGSCPMSIDELRVYGDPR